MPARARLLAALALALLCPAASSAQDTEPGGGAWFSAGLGAGFSEDGGGLAFYVRAGGTPAPGLRAGAEVIGVTDLAVTTFNGTATVLLRPGASPLFLKGGAGLAIATSGVDFDGGLGGGNETATGVGVTVGAAYEIPLGNGLALTPGVDALLQSFDGFADSNALLLTIGLGLR